MARGERSQNRVSSWSGVMTRVPGTIQQVLCLGRLQTDPCGCGACSWHTPRAVEPSQSGVPHLMRCPLKPHLPQARLALRGPHVPGSAGRAWCAVGVCFILGLRAPWWPQGHSLGSAAWSSESQERPLFLQCPVSACTSGADLRLTWVPDPAL